MGLYKMIEKKRKEQKRKQKVKVIKTAGITAFVGVGVGAVTGILLAPKSGKETRGDLVDKTSRAKGEIIEKSKMFKENLNDKVEESKKDIANAKGKITEYLASKKRKSEEEITVDETEVEATDDAKLEE